MESLAAKLIAQAARRAGSRRSRSASRSRSVHSVIDQLANIEREEENRDEDRGRESEDNEYTDLSDGETIGTVSSLKKGEKEKQKRKVKGKTLSTKAKVGESIGKKTGKTGKIGEETWNAMAEAMTALAREMGEMKVKINKIESKGEQDEDLEDSVFEQESWAVNSSGLPGLASGKNVRHAVVSNMIKYAQRVNLTYNRSLGMRDFITTAEAHFSHWSQYPVEYMSGILAILPPEYTLALRRVDKASIPVSEFYKKLIMISGESETETERKQRFYATSVADADSFLSLVTKLENAGSNIFTSKEDLNKEVVQKLESLLPGKWREDIRRYVERKNRTKKQGNWVWPEPVELCGVLSDEMRDINQWIKSKQKPEDKGGKIRNLNAEGEDFPPQRQSARGVNQNRKPPCDICYKTNHTTDKCFRKGVTLCVLCGSTRHLAPTCLLYKGETVCQRYCGICHNHDGRKLYHAESTCKYRLFLE